MQYQDSLVDFNYSNIKKTFKDCPLCGSKDFEAITIKDRYRMKITTSCCKHCKFVMTNPAPTDDEMDYFYRYHYRTIYRKSDRPNPQLIQQYGLEKRARYTVNLLDGLIGHDSYILDVGCAEGSLLREMKMSYPNSKITGIELSLEYAEFARGYSGSKVFPALDLISDEKFDLIIAIHVLEHVTNPVRFLEKLKLLIKEDGIIYLDVPDSVRYNSINDLHIAHLFHFSSGSLLSLARKTGLIATFIEQHDPPHHPKSVRCTLKLRGSEISIRDIESDNVKVCEIIKRIDTDYLK